MKQDNTGPEPRDIGYRYLDISKPVRILELVKESQLEKIWQSLSISMLDFASVVILVV
jgi:hypothetical protein